MPARVEQGSRSLKSLLAPLAICRKPLVTAALCFLAGMVFFWFARGVWGCGWRPFGGRFTCDEVMAARRNARYATQVLGSFLGDGPRAYGWRQYLRLDELQAELGDGDYPPPTSRTDPKLVADVVNQLSRPYPGLELKEFTGLRSALSAYLKMLETSDPVPEFTPPPEPRTAVMPQSRYR